MNSIIYLLGDNDLEELSSWDGWSMFSYDLLGETFGLCHSGSLTKKKKLRQKFVASIDIEEKDGQQKNDSIAISYYIYIQYVNNIIYLRISYV